MKTVKFENATIWISAIVPFKNNFISCNALVQIAFFNASSFDIDVVEIEDVKNLVTDMEMRFDQAIAAHAAFGINLNNLIDDHVSEMLTKEVVLDLAKHSLSVLL